MYYSLYVPSELTGLVAFKVYDMDRDGFISNGELFIVLKMMVGNNLKDQQLQQVVLLRKLSDCRLLTRLLWRLIKMGMERYHLKNFVKWWLLRYNIWQYAKLIVGCGCQHDSGGSLGCCRFVRSERGYTLSTITLWKYNLCM